MLLGFGSEEPVEVEVPDYLPDDWA